MRIARLVPAAPAALLVAVALAVLVSVAAAAPPARAGGTGPSSSTTTTSGASINGRLLAGATPITGVRVTVRRGGALVGEAVSGRDGRFSIAVPGPGAYDVALDPATIPARFELVDPRRITLRGYRVFGSFAQSVVFAFKGSAPGAPAAARRSTLVQLSNLTASGVRIGLIVGLCAVGLSLVYGTTRLVNFAHGELVTFGALSAYFFSTSTGGPRWPLVTATPLAVVAGGLLGGGLELGLWRPIRRRTSNNARMLVSIGLALFLRYLYQVVFTGNSRTYRQYSAQRPTTLGPIELPLRDYLSMLIALAALLGVALVLQRTRLGTAVRAVADERDLAAASGIDVGRVIVAVWVGGAALSALGGVLLGVGESVQWNMGFRLLLTIFAAVVLGGLGSAYGAMAGGIAVGVASEVSTYWLPADFKVVVGLGILVLVLLVRPQGLLGVRERIG